MKPFRPIIVILAGLFGALAALPASAQSNAVAKATPSPTVAGKNAAMIRQATVVTSGGLTIEYVYPRAPRSERSEFTPPLVWIPPEHSQSTARADR